MCKIYVYTTGTSIYFVSLAVLDTPRQYALSARDFSRVRALQRILDIAIAGPQGSLNTQFFVIVIQYLTVEHFFIPFNILSGIFSFVC